ncbi:MAG: hypothetical protein LQ341_002073 [Variospora aurantia]|nr:MAG: hypothetical protein LQ341_002073 [Variospora aurantia]
MSSFSSEDNSDSTEAVDNFNTALQELQVDEALRGAGISGPSSSEGKTFVVDPDVFAQWTSGQHSTSRNASPKGNRPSLHRGEGDKLEESQPAAQNTSSTGIPMEIGAGSGKAKRKKNKPKSKRGLAAPTGFEEFYVDAPLTPVELKEEQNLYDPDIDFSRRIEYAIQRFCVRRNMDSAKKDVFDKYLALGGISAGPKQFAGGLDAANISDMTAAEITLMKATHFVHADKWGEDGAYEVDFATCAKAFLSSRVPWLYDLTGPDSVKKVKAKTNIIRNFLNYLLHHDVCPEYRSQIVSARGVCDLADKELPMVMQAQSYLPGEFQTACSEIFGGSFRGIHGETPAWATDARDLIGMKLDLAKQTFRIGMSTHVSDEVAKAYVEQNENSDITTTKIYKLALEITELIRASTEVKTFYEHHPAAKGLKPLGRLVAKTWDPPFRLPQDLTPEEKAAEASWKPQSEVHGFLVEDYVLETCFVGMKLEVTVREMSFGLKFFDTVHGIFCTFYTLLPNELMIGWKIPEAEPLPYREKNKEASVPAGNLDGVEDSMEDDEEV